jgi:hypothetical protein
MSQNYVVPNIYQDMSDQNQGYFAFRFICQECQWSIETRPVRSQIATNSNVIDLGVGMLNGFWGRAAEFGEKVYGSKWHTELLDALQKAWAEIQPNFHFCSKCRRTVCMRCFNVQLNLCIICAPDLKADAAQFQHGLNIEEQRKQLQEHYQGPRFNTDAVPSAVTPDMVRQPQSPPLLSQGNAYPAAPTPPSAAALAGMGTPGYPQAVMCPMCRRMGPPGKFCQDCGSKLPLPALFCPKCAELATPGARFCAECGTNLQ